MKQNKFYIVIFTTIALFVSTLLGGGVNLNRVSEDEVIKLYIATFERVPDVQGLEYWQNSSNLTIEEIAQSFFDQSETQSKYPATLSTDNFVKSVYNNLFGREPDSKGLEYWVGELDNNKISKDAFILAVINGALDNDAKILLTKTDFATKFMSENKNLSSTEYKEKAKSDFETLTRSLEDNQDYNSGILARIDNLLDNIKDNINDLEDKYNEYSDNQDDRGERPFTPIFQSDDSDKTTIISSNCSSNRDISYLYYETPTDAQNSYFSDISNLISNPQNGDFRPYMDIRYSNPVTKYIDNANSDFYPNHSEFTALDVRSGANNIAIGTSASSLDSSGGITQS